MPLSTGDKLGPYEIISLLGKGGMGEVYKARDTRLNRDVAIKTSAKQFSERFEREARAIAALNHPNICTLYDVGPNYLVMEYVEGAPLKGPYPLDKALDYARQIASALEAAHDKAITHRDLKPGNIMLKPDGVIKVLDFGLAKVGPASAGRDPGQIEEDSPTLTMGLTVAGTILGTAAYMAPEQAKGKEVDKRADIWAFGVVLHEMLTGERLFKGEDLTETLAAVVMKDPDFGSVPHEVRRLLKRCLQKDPAKRLRDIADVWELVDQPPLAPSPIVQGPSSKLPWIAAGALGLSLAGLGAWVLTRPAAESDTAVARFNIVPPAGSKLTIVNAVGPQTAVSPDGRSIAFVAATAGIDELWVRDVDSFSSHRLDQTENASMPFWSPDSKHIAFFANGKLRRIPMSGGTPIGICDSPGSTSGVWFQPPGSQGDGVILFGGVRDPVIHRVPASGGVPVPLTKMELGATSHRYPQVLPDGRRFLYYATIGTRPGVYVQDLESGQSRFLFDAPGRALIAPPNYLLFVRDNALLAQRWDWDALQPTSEPVAVADEVAASFNGSGSNSFSVSNTGVLAYRSGIRGVSVQYRWFSRDGKPEDSGTEPAIYELIRMAPDGRKAVLRRIAFGGGDLFLLEVASGVLSQLTSDAAMEGDPVWSPDSRRVAFTTREGNRPGVYVTTVGSGKSDLIYPGITFIEDWKPDGLLVRRPPAVGLLPSPPENPVAPLSPKLQLLAELPETDQFVVSPDGKWVAYCSRQNSSREVWVAAYPSFTERRKVADGISPLWRADGKEIFFVVPDKGLWSMAVNSGAGLVTGPPSPLFNPPGAHIDLVSAQYFAVSNDGKRFLVRVSPAVTTGEVEPVNVVLNWPALVK